MTAADANVVGRFSGFYSQTRRQWTAIGLSALMLKKPLSVDFRYLDLAVQMYERTGVFATGNVAVVLL